MRDGFFNAARAGLFKHAMTQGEVDGCNAILDDMAGQCSAFTAYVLATAFKETAHTMHPVEEFGGPSYFFRRYDIQGNRPDIARQLGNTKPGDGAKYHGRDYVQTTGRANYQKATTALSVDFIDHPELIAQLPNAAAVMRLGMLDGWFTGRRLADYLPHTGQATLTQYTSARRIINGVDCNVEIAEYALAFQDYIAGGI
jgi:putative chitinase